MKWTKDEPSAVGTDEVFETMNILREPTPQEYESYQNMKSKLQVDRKEGQLEHLLNTFVMYQDKLAQVRVRLREVVTRLNGCTPELEKCDENPCGYGGLVGKYESVTRMYRDLIDETEGLVSELENGI